MGIQQGKPNCLCRSVWIRARYCRRIVIVQVLEKKLLEISERSAPSCGRVSLRGLAGVLYSRIMTPACAHQHPCGPTHIFTHIHTRIHRYSQTCTHSHTHSHTFKHIHTHTHTYTSIHSHTLKQ